MTHRRDETTDAGRQSPRFTTVLAEDHDTVLAAQRLRHRVFSAATREGAATQGVDADAFDPHCRHLVVRDTTTDAVVGTYRILTVERARAAGGFYSETEFDCARLHRLNGRLVEVGRACVDPAYRGGGVIGCLLAALTRWVVAERYDWVMGCASVDLAAGTDAAAALCRGLVDEHLGPEEWRVVPHRPFTRTSPAVLTAAASEIPPLIKAYLRFGAKIAGPPAEDPVFRTADLLMLLPMATMAPRFRARLLREPGTEGPARRTRWAA